MGQNLAQSPHVAMKETPRVRQISAASGLQGYRRWEKLRTEYRIISLSRSLYLDECIQYSDVLR